MGIFHNAQKRVAVLVLLIFIGLFAPNILQGADHSNALGNNEPHKKLITIKGTVKNEFGVPLIGVSIHELGSDAIVQTDEAGQYQIEIHSTEAVLIFKREGFIAEGRKLEGKDELHIRLSESSLKVEKQFPISINKKQPGSTQSIGNIFFEETFENRQLSDPTQIIGSQNGAIQISGTSLLPGNFSSIVGIRGSSAFGGHPLVLLDNVPVDPSTIDPNEIKHVSILKDASASALFGSRASFGVILITSKSTTADNGHQINYSNQFSHFNPLDTPEKSSISKQVQHMSDMGLTHSPYGHDLGIWRMHLDKFRQNPNTYQQGSVMYDGLRYGLANGKDEWNRLVNNKGYLTQHNLNANGGNKQSSYRISLSYLENDGILRGNSDHYSQVNLASSFSSKIGAFIKTDVSLNYFKGDQNLAQVNLWNAYWAPAYANFDGDGDGDAIPYFTPSNVAQLEDSHRRQNQQLRASGTIDLKITKGLHIIGTFTNSHSSGTARNNQLRKDYQNIFTANPILFSNQELQFEEGNHNVSYSKLNAKIIWKRSFGSSHLRFSSGYSSDWQNAKMEQMSFNESLPGNFDQSSFQSKINGSYANISYNYDNRYTLVAAARYDETYRYFTGQRNELSTNVSASWNLTEEAFLANQGLLNLLNLRISWGEVSELQHEKWAATARMSYKQGGKEYYNTNIDPLLLAYAFGNYQQSWIENQTLNWGSDFAFIQNKLSGSFDFFSRDTWYLADDISAQGSALAQLNTKGWELEMKWNQKIANDINYNIGANISNYKSVITDHNLENNQMGSNLYLGQEIGDIWGLYSQGFYQQEDFVDGSLDQQLENGILKEEVSGPSNHSVRPGDSKYLDLNKDGIIGYSNNQSNDLSIIGNSTPKYILRLFGTLNYQGLDLSMAISGVGKMDVIDDTTYGLSLQQTEGSLFTHQENYWRSDRLDAFYPRPAIGGSEAQAYNYLPQSKLIFNGAYIKLDNVTIGFTFPKTLTQNIKVKRLRFYLGGENLAIWNHLPKGWHAIPGANGLLPITTQLTAGLNLSI